MFTSTRIALATALILGAASTALANDSGENHQDSDRSVVSGNAARSIRGLASPPMPAALPAPQRRSSASRAPGSSVCNILYPIPVLLFSLMAVTPCCGLGQSGPQIEMSGP
jgi:hypothetical protein